MKKCDLLTIKSCKDSSLWYNNHIGKSFRILDVWDEIGYKVLQPEGFINYIKFEDAKLEKDNADTEH